MILAHRASGVLLHITALPSNFGIGDMGPESYRFIDLLAQANQHYWSILPLTPTSTQCDNSPYQPTSAFAGNTLLISPEVLIEDNLLSEENVKELNVPFGRVAFKEVTKKKKTMLNKAYQNFIKKSKTTNEDKDDFEKFCAENNSWLDEYALFKALRESLGQPWFEWPNDLRDRKPEILTQKRYELRKQIDQEKFAQFIFFTQWNKLKSYCRTKEVRIFGDLPFYMGYDSSDVWANSKLFKLGASKKPLFVGGVPPDYFSSTGQRWGNPVYDWREIKKTKFLWWIERFSRNLQMFDLLRLDHFRGYVAYWQIPAFSKTAKEGKWIRAPSKTFFKTLQNNFPTLPLIAEDLGLITDNVKKYLQELKLAGMRVLIFAFDGSPDNSNLPKNIIKNSVVYTGTHDTNTVQGWFVEEANKEQIKQVSKYFGKVSKDSIGLEFIKLALTSRAYVSIIPVQDVLGLGSETRMNHPATQTQNWDWRIKREQLSSTNFQGFAKLTKRTERC